MNFNTARRRARLSQRDLAEKAGVHYHTVIRVEHGSVPSFRVQKALANALGVQDPETFWKTPA